MTIWAIVPVKPLLRAKSRLSSVLSSEQRAELSQELLLHTLDVLDQVPEIEQTLVVSRDTRALALAREHHARTVTEHGSPTLNPALLRATALAKRAGASAVLVLPADLPYLTIETVRELIELSGDPPVVVVAPDRHEKGTNALLVAPPGLIEYEFGTDSYAHHLQLGRSASARVEICKSPALGLDLDAPEDLEIYRNTNNREARLKP